jgi:DNA-binding NarL/FixJ family response regulator
MLVLARLRDPKLDADVRSLGEALAILGERYSIGVLVCDPSGGILFASARARRLLGSPVLPTELQSLAETGREDLRSVLPGSHHAVHARTTRLAGTPRHLLITLEEEGPRTSLSKSLVEHFGLSARSIQLVQLASRGLKNREIGARLRLSEATVKTYMHGLFRELGVRNRAELVSLAERLARDGRSPDG